MFCTVEDLCGTHAKDTTKCYCNRCSLILCTAIYTLKSLLDNSFISTHQTVHWFNNICIYYLYKLKNDLSV